MEGKTDLPPSYATDYGNNYGQQTGAYPAQTQFSPSYGYSGPAVTNQSQSTYGNTVIVSQPQPATILATTVPDNFGLAVFATICCFWPLGIFAIMKASDSRAALGRGDLSSALISANESRRLSLISIGVGILVIIGVIIAVVVIVVNNQNSAYYYYSGK
ncbi:hypothetical protein BsWGS_19225 [Bradybaena similaris]